MIRSAVSAALLLVLALPARAQSFAYEFGQSSYFVNPGGMIDVSIYLRELSPGAVLSTEGLFSAGVRLDWGSSLAGAQVLSTNDIVVNPLFNDPGLGNPTFDLQPTSAGLVAYRDLFSADGVTAGPDGRLLLGTFRFTARDMPGAAISIQASDFAATTDTVTWLGSASLDGLIASGSASITVTPEPAYGIAFVIAVAGSYLGITRRQMCVA